MALPALNTTSNVIRPLQSTVVISLYEAIPISMGSLTSEEQVSHSAGHVGKHGGNCANDWVCPTTQDVWVLRPLANHNIF